MIAITARQEIERERRRQIEAEGWSAEHDDTHQSGDLTEAAICYYLSGTSGAAISTATGAPINWPWDPQWWKPHGKRRDLVRAGALILAEGDRLQRAGVDSHEVTDNWLRFIGKALDATPKRIRRLRAEGFVMPDKETYVYVGRPGRFGNPWKIGLKACGHRSAGECGCNAFRVETAEEAVARYREWLQGSSKLRARALADLAGKDLACWCALDRPCHADVLLELVNPSAVTP